MKGVAMISLHHIRRTTCVACAAACAFLSYGQTPNALPDSGNYIDVSLGYLDLDGNEASFLQSRGVKKHAFGGIEAFNYYAALPNYTDLYITGKAIEDNGEYALRIKLINTDIGFIDIDWTENRYWYDGTGGFLPGGFTIDLRDDELSLTRGEFSITGGLTMKDLPRIELSYRHRYRDGLKASTIWGDSNLTGGIGTRGISPAYLDIDETTDTVEAKVSGSIDNTEISLAARFEKTDGDNARLLSRRPNEPGVERRVTQRERYETDLLNLRTTTVTRIGEKTTITTGASYTTIDADTRGSRIYGAGFDVVFDPTFRRQNRDEGFLNLHSQSDSDQWVINGNVMFMPRKNLKAVIALRAEDLSVRTDSEVLETNFFNVSQEHDLGADVRSSWNEYSASSELIYTGQENAVYTASALYSFGDGDLYENQVDLHTGASGILRNTEIDREVSKLALGAKFYPSRAFSHYWQYYHKERNNDYDNRVDSTAATGGDRFPAYQSLLDFAVDDVNVRLNWKPLPGFSSVTRFDYQVSKIDNRMDGLDTIEASATDSFIYSQIFSWTTEKLFLQTSFNLVNEIMKTPASSIANIGAAFNDFSNDYASADLVAQWAVGDDADMVFRAYYLKAENFVDTSALSTPYGGDLTEKGATLSWSKPLRENMRLTLQYGYYTKDDRTYGGLNDYDAQILSSKIRYRF